MEYKELYFPGRAVPGTDIQYRPTYAIDINDFDSMCLRLVRQLSKAQIEEKIQRAYDETEWI